MSKIACTHPGKIGDALYALPTIRKICKIISEEEKKEVKADFYTSEYCRPIKRLMEYQSCVNKVFIPDTYEIQRMDMGVQPYRVPVDITFYDAVYHLGFRRVPDKAIPDFICESIGLELPVKVKYDYPDFITNKEPYIVVAPRGETSFKKLFCDFVIQCPITCYIIGGETDDIGYGVDITGMDFLETLVWIAQAKGFVGLQSSMLVLANGFDIPKVAVHDGIHWDMRHVVYSDTNFYPINPTVQDIFKLLGIKEK